MTNQQFMNLRMIGRLIGEAQRQVGEAQRQLACSVELQRQLVEELQEAHQRSKQARIDTHNDRKFREYFRATNLPDRAALTGAVTAHE